LGAEKQIKPVASKSRVIQISLTMEKQINRIILDNSQAIELATFGFTKVNGQIMFKMKRFDTFLQAINDCKAGEMVAETNTAAFILSPSNKHSERVHPALQTLSRS
jgi:putative IMPACT (imprinted ancient) family translation regulator